VTTVEWALGLTSSLVVLLLVTPVAVLVGGLIVFMAANHVFTGPMVGRTSFDCPFSKRQAKVEFLSEAGSEHPTDVLSCSVFAPRPYHVRCEKRCLALAETGWALSPMMPRYALLSGGVGYRVASSFDGRDNGSALESSSARTA
jgi:hypothetical protein